VVRSRLILAVLGVLCASVVEAQQSSFIGLASLNLGATTGGDVNERTLSPSGALAVVESSGLGAELDLGHTMNFAGDQFAESGLTTVMLNVIGLWPHPIVRPFVSAGAGLLRGRVSLFEGQPIFSRSEAGGNVGGGLLLVFDDVVGVRGEVRYFRYFERQTDVPIANGFGGFWRTSVGVVFSWPIR
jgi:hypothetical protein